MSANGGIVGDSYSPTNGMNGMNGMHDLTGLNGMNGMNGLNGVGAGGPGVSSNGSSGANLTKKLYVHSSLSLFLCSCLTIFSVSTNACKRCRRQKVRTPFNAVCIRRESEFLLDGVFR